MARKTWEEMGMVSIGAVEVLGLAESLGTEGTGGSDDVRSGLVVLGTLDAGM